MSEEIKKVGFGAVNDADESLRGKSPGGTFGLNSAVNVVKFEFNGNAGKDGDAGDAVDIVILIGDRETNTRVYDVTRVYDKDNQEISDTESPEYIKGYNEQIVQNMAVIVHVAKSLGVTQAQLDRALAVPLNSFKEWAEVVISLVPDNFKSQSVDLFLEYQWTIGKDQKRTFLQIPKNMKGGRFLCPSVKPVGSWTEEREWTTKDEAGEDVENKGLRYVDGANNVHPFKRSEMFMDSPKANMQSDRPAVTASPMAGVSTSAGQKKSNW